MLLLYQGEESYADFKRAQERVILTRKEGAAHPGHLQDLHWLVRRSCPHKVADRPRLWNAVGFIGQDLW